MNHQGQSLQQSSPNSSSGKGNEPPKHLTWGVWNDENFEKASELFLKGMSARQIAERFGMSRNAVLGKMHRHGIKRADEVKVRANSRSPARPRLKIVKANGNSATMRVYKSVEQGLLKLRAVEIEPRNIPLADLGKSDCRYPYGDGPFLFCGHPKLEGSSFCGPHHALCWIPPKGRVA